MQITTHTYIGKFKIETKTFDHLPEKVKLTSYNKRNGFIRKDSAPDVAMRQAHEIDKRDKRTKCRLLQRLDAKLAKGKISIEEYHARKAAL